EDLNFRYVTVVDLLRYHELPWWNAWLCGGFPTWGNAEGANNLVSPYLPLYLALPIQVAARVEVVLTTICAIAFAALLATRVTRSVAVCALVGVVFGMNGRWVLQFSEGHMWHLTYAWMPLAMYLFDVSLDRCKLRCAAWAGVVLALIAYMGGIY